MRAVTRETQLEERRIWTYTAYMPLHPIVFLQRGPLGDVISCILLYHFLSDKLPTVREVGIYF